VTRAYGARLDVEPDVLRERFLADLGHVTTKVGADAAVVDDDERVLLVRRTDDGLWGLPAGWVEPGEDPRVTVARELKEELGVDGTPDELVGVFARPASARHPHGVVAVVFLCSLHSFDFAVQPHEVLEYAWLPVDAVDEWHETHEQYARAGVEAWRRRRGR